MPADAGREKTEENMSGAPSGPFSGSFGDLFSLSESTRPSKKIVLLPHLLCYNFKGCWLLTEEKAGSE